MTEVSKAPGSLKGEAVPEQLSRLGAAVARRAAEIRATVPDLELSTDVEITATLESADAGGHSLGAILVAAAAAAARGLPWANAAYRDGQVERYGRVNVGYVVTTDDALVIATVLDADAKTPAALTEELARLTERARNGTLTAPEQAGATFTVADYTALGAARITPMITPPQVASLTAGAVRRAPVVAPDGTIAAGAVITLTLACDHRALFGERAARLLARIAELVRGRP